MLTAPVLLAAAALGASARPPAPSLSPPVHLELRRHPVPPVTRRRRDTLGIAQDLVLTNIVNNLYAAEISIGTPPQPFIVHLDTGSTDMYVYDSGCHVDACAVAGETRFDAAASSTHKELGKVANMTYGFGFTDGVWATDVVSWGQMTVGEQSFVRALDTDDTYKPTNITGLMGMAWTPSSTSKEVPFWQNMVSQWADQRFAFYLGPTDDRTRETKAGLLTLGGVDTTLYTGEIHYVDLVSKGLWVIPLDGLAVAAGGSETPLPTPKARAAIDTGTSLVAVPHADAEAIYAAIPGSGLDADLSNDNLKVYAVPCDTDAVVSLTFGGVAYAIPLENFVLPKDNFPGQCIGAIQGNAKVGYWIVGDVFLRSVYSVFRYDPPSIGFAALAPGLQKDAPSYPDVTVFNPPLPDRKGSGEDKVADGQWSALAPWLLALATIMYYW
ncbi:hypothetical protein Q8F55_005531 [Vanrija albida]|uniref:Peptidase A1 domain-containing protein n=1 Tax=Vanrija albida TaxID=181172 RepID=A0ABR3Q242_9TREE